VAVFGPRTRVATAQWRAVDDVIDDERGVVDQLDPDGEVDGVGRGRRPPAVVADQLAAGGLEGEQRHHRPHPLAPRQRDVLQTLGHGVRLRRPEDGLESPLDERPTPLEILHDRSRAGLRKNLTKRAGASATREGAARSD